MIQDNNTVLENYKANCALFNKIKSKTVDMVIVGHNHCDHIGLIPMLFARGNTKARIIVPKHSSSILREMWLDCAWINQRDVDSLNYKGDHSYTPLYTEHEVEIALKHIEEYDCGEILKVIPDISSFSSIVDITKDIFIIFLSKQ